MRYFETRGPVNPEKNYMVARTGETVEFINRIKEGRYIVLFAPRQTGKTTFFRGALDTLSTEDPNFFPIQLDFQIMRNVSSEVFYERLFDMVRSQIESVFKQREESISVELTRLLKNTQFTDSYSMLTFFKQIDSILEKAKIVVLIDEFDGIPETVVSDFLYTIRHIYISKEFHCPHCIGIVGVKSITQLNYDRSISPFNIQDDFNLPHFTLEQVQELLMQYSEETGQHFASDVIIMLHRHTGGQPFLVNRIAQILTEEQGIPKDETICLEHFFVAHAQIVQERNTNIQHLITNVRRDSAFKSILMKIMSYDSGVPFNLYDDLLNELVTYGVIVKGKEDLCEIVNPIYQSSVQDPML